VVFLLAPGLHLLDLAGPAQVFSELTEIGRLHAVRPYAAHYVADHPEITTAQGLTIRADSEWPALTAEDLVFVPGWRSGGGGTGALSETALERLRDHHRRGGTVASVCSGADALGRAGLLDDRRFTTHHRLLDSMAKRYPRARAVRDVLFVEDRGVVTSAGIASGIDLALHLVADRHGSGVAALVARAMVVFARRNGDQPQDSVMVRHRAHLDDAVHRVQDVIEARLADRVPLAELSGLSGCSERTLTRMFVRATGLTPLRYQQALRLERAEQAIGQGESVELAARVVGFEDARMLRRLRARHAAG
jgi:transcriptional regulator GlxA family with amidase domain